MAQPIPAWWCKTVVGVLETNDPKAIDWTAPGYQRWHADTFGCIPAEAYPGITGNETTSYPGQEATYEFFFWFHPPNGGKARMIYGKIALMKGRVRILILSAHNPERNSL